MFLDQNNKLVKWYRQANLQNCTKIRHFYQRSYKHRRTPKIYQYIDHLYSGIARTHNTLMHSLVAMSAMTLSCSVLKKNNDCHRSEYFINFKDKLEIQNTEGLKTNLLNYHRQTSLRHFHHHSHNDRHKTLIDQYIDHFYSGIPRTHNALMQSLVAMSAVALSCSVLEKNDDCNRSEYVNVIFQIYSHLQCCYSEHQHLRSDHSYDFPTQNVCMKIALTHNLYNKHRQAIFVQFHRERYDLGKQPLHLENQAVCRQHEHRLYPSCHHKLFPIDPYSKLLPVLHCENHQQVVHLKLNIN